MKMIIQYIVFIDKTRLINKTHSTIQYITPKNHIYKYPPKVGNLLAEAAKPLAWALPESECPLAKPLSAGSTSPSL